MASMFIRHRVADFGKWKSVFDDHEGTRRQFGATSHSLHRDADDPNVVIIAARVTDIARAKEFIASQDLRETMQQAGIVGQPEFWFTEDVEEKTY